MKPALLFLLLLLAHAQAAEDWVVGTFFGRELMQEGSDLERVVELTVEKAKDGGGGLVLNGGFWYTEGRMPAPDFEGAMTASEKGKVRFSFRDSYANEGIATLMEDGKGAMLKIKITQVRNSRCLMLYNEIWLKRY